MRALCGVPPPAPAARLAGAARFVSLRAPPAAAPLVLLLDAKARVRDLRQHAVAHLHHHGITDTDIFGIAVLCGKFLLNLLLSIFQEEPCLEAIIAANTVQKS